MNRLIIAIVGSSRLVQKYTNFFSKRLANRVLFMIFWGSLRLLYRINFHVPHNRLRTYQKTTTYLYRMTKTLAGMLLTASTLISPPPSSYNNTPTIIMADFTIRQNANHSGEGHFPSVKSACSVAGVLCMLVVVVDDSEGDYIITITIIIVANTNG